MSELQPEQQPSLLRAAANFIEVSGALLTCAVVATIAMGNKWDKPAQDQAKRDEEAGKKLSEAAKDTTADDNTDLKPIKKKD